MSEKPSQRALSKLKKLTSRPPPPYRRTFPEIIRDFLLMLLTVKILGLGNAAEVKALLSLFLG